MKSNITSKTVSAIDWVGMSLSVLCAIHCLAAPVFLTALSVFGLEAGGEGFETMMIYTILAVAIFAGVSGWRKHRSWLPARLFAAGALAFLAVRPAVDHYWEPVATVIGGSLLIVGHYRNWVRGKPCDKHCV